MDDLAILEDVGLSDKEARIYLCLLETGATSTEVIAMKTKIKRPTVYFVLGQLVERALVLRVARKRKQLFSARSPQDLLAMEQGRLNRLSSALPSLLARFAVQQDKNTRALLFEGAKGIREAYFYRINELHDSEIFGLYGTATDLSPEGRVVIDEWNAYNKKHHIHTKAIVPDHPSLKTYRKNDEKENRTVYILPYDAYTSDISMEITKYFVRIHLFDSQQCLIIESKKIVTVWQQIFMML